MKKVFTILTAAIVSSATLLAQDKALLETLVKKGMLTRQEATQIAKESVAVTPASKGTKSIKLFGGIQGWFKWADNSISSGSASMDQISGFELRYVKVGLHADVGHGWTATLVMDFGSDGDKRNYLDKVVISKKVDIDYVNGELQIGLRKSNMGIEQTTDDFALLAIDHSVATNFFTHTGFSNSANKYFGSRTVGVFWDGEIPQVEGLYYGAAITSEITEGNKNELINNINSNSGLSYYISVGYKNLVELDGKNFNYDFGVNLGYASKGFTLSATSQKSEIWGLNPYLKLKYGEFSAVAEMFYQSVENAKGFNQSANPLGANLILAYKVDLDGQIGAIEPVLRLSYVSADTMGVAVSSAGTTCYFNEAKTVFVGFNIYFSDSIKTSLGYEYGYYESGSNPAVADTLTNNTVLAQLQVIF